MTKSKLKYRQRKPDKETELLRIWTPKKGSEESKEIEEATKNNSIEINYKGMKIQICGFNTLTNNKTNKMIFAYKFRHDEKFVIYYIPDNNLEGQKCFNQIRYILELGGYGLQNMEENLKSVYAEFKEEKNGKK